MLLPSDSVANNYQAILTDAPLHCWDGRGANKTKSFHQRRLGMNAKEQLIFDTIKKLDKKKITIEDAVILLQKSKRTIERYCKKYHEEDFLFVYHKNRNRIPVNKTSDKIKEKVQELIKTKYYDLNLAHLREILERDENICIKRSTLNNWANEIH